MTGREEGASHLEAFLACCTPGPPPCCAPLSPLPSIARHVCLFLRIRRHLRVPPRGMRSPPSSSPNSCPPWLAQARPLPSQLRGPGLAGCCLVEGGSTTTSSSICRPVSRPLESGEQALGLRGGGQNTSGNGFEGSDTRGAQHGPEFSPVESRSVRAAADSHVGHCRGSVRGGRCTVPGTGPAHQGVTYYQAPCQACSWKCLRTNVYFIGWRTSVNFYFMDVASREKQLPVQGRTASGWYAVTLVWGS